MTSTTYRLDERNYRAAAWIVVLSLLLAGAMTGMMIVFAILWAESVPQYILAVVLPIPFVLMALSAVRTSICLTDGGVIETNIRSRTFPYREIADAFVDLEIQGQPVVLAMRSGEKITLTLTLKKHAEIAGEIRRRLPASSHSLVQQTNDEAFEVRSTAGARFFGWMFVVMALFLVIGPFTNAFEGETQVQTQLGLAAFAVMFLWSANKVFSTLTIDRDSFSVRTLLFTRTVRFSEVGSVKRTYDRGGDVLIFDTHSARDFKLGPRMYRDEHRVRQVIRRRIEARGLAWPDSNPKLTRGY